MNEKKEKQVCAFHEDVDSFIINSQKQHAAVQKRFDKMTVLLFVNIAISGSAFGVRIWEFLLSCASKFGVTL